MRIHFKSILCAFALLIAMPGIAQNKNGNAKKNIIKLNLSSLVFSNVSIQYERVISKKASVAMGLSVRPKSKLPFRSVIKDQFEQGSDVANSIDDTKIGNVSVTPEFRYYVGQKGAPQGFYIAPFLRFNSQDVGQLYRFTAPDNVNHNVNITGNIDSFGGGILFGSQWQLSERLTFDWWILGPSIGKTKGDLVGTDPINIQPQFRSEIERDIESVDLPGVTIDASVEQNRITANVHGPYYGFRTFGFVLGFKF